MLAFYLSLVDDEDQKSLIEQLYKTNRQTMYSIAVSRLHNSQDAEDAVHEAFIVAINNIEKIFSFPANKRASYLNVIVRNMSCTVLRRKKPTTDIEEEIITGDTSPEDEAISCMEYERLTQLIKELPEGQRDVMYLRYYLELDIREIASSLSISETAVRNRLFKARKSLQKQLENDSD